jgi:hypothetical protein
MGTLPPGDGHDDAGGGQSPLFSEIRKKKTKKRKSTFLKLVTTLHYI